MNGTSLRKITSLSLVTLLAAACSPISKYRVPDTSDAEAHHTVLASGQQAVFRNANGSGKIIWISNFVRRYEIDDTAYDVRLTQRLEEFRNQKGIYNPGESWGWLNPSDDRISRFVVEESELNFKSMSECRNFMGEGADYYQWVCGPNGLVLGFFLSPGRDQANVSLFRVSINGVPLQALPESYRHPGNVRITSSPESAQR